MARFMAVVGLLALAGCEKGPVELPSCDEVELPAAGALVVDGTRIVDGSGREVTLRGINAGGRSKFAPFAPLDYDDYTAELQTYLDRPETWGFDVLRVPFSWAAVEPTPGNRDEAFLARYDQIIDGAWERGMWTIVDFHQDVYSEVYCGDGFPGWTLDDPPDPHHDCPEWFSFYLLDDDVVDAFDAFWTDANGTRTSFGGMWDLMATRYADHPGVIGFEVINEPGWGRGDRDEWARDVLTPFYGEMAARIQGRDPDALVFFDSTGLDALAAETSLELPAGDNLVFAPHFYDPSIFFQEGPLEADVVQALSDWKATADGWDVPVLLGEFGIEHDHDQAASYVRDHYTAFDSLDMHATYWEYSAATELWNEENLSVVEADGTERPVILDEIVRPYVRALAGTRSEEAFYDRESGVFDLRFTPDGGITEIMLPSRLYSAGTLIEGQGACVERLGSRLLVLPDEDVEEVWIRVAP